MDRRHTIMPVPSKTNSHTYWQFTIQVHINAEVTTVEQKEKKSKAQKTHWSAVKQQWKIQVNYTRVLWKVFGLTVKKQIYNFKIIFIFQHNLP